MYVRSLFLLFIILPIASADERLDEYYRRAVPGAERFLERSDNFTIYSLFDNIAILVSANTDLPKEQCPDMELVTKLLRIAETMQDRNPESPTFGNFHWYRNHTAVTDPNAVEFAVARMLTIFLDTPKPLSPEDQSTLRQMLEFSAVACQKRRIPSDYTNIALYNAVHLILLGQIIDRSDITQEGARRLQNIAFHIWDHGIFEYNSPAYYFVDVDALQLALRHVQHPQTKQTISALLELFWTDLALHWYQPGLRLAGAQSRSNNYLYGTGVQMTRHFSFAGLAPFDNRGRYHALLNSFRAWYQPPLKITKLNNQYPRLITRNWGKNPGQWAAMYMSDDITLGTAGTKYDSKQNMVQTVDITDDNEANNLVDKHFLPRSYFIADGREDPYGTKLFATGRGGQQKPLHLDAFWYGAQRTVDSLGLALYPPEVLTDPIVMNVQSHFVIRKPESLWFDGKQIILLPHQPIRLGNMPVIFRYKTCAFGIRTVWSRHQDGTPTETLLIDDENDHGVYRLTVEHGKPAKQSPNANWAGTAFWVRIGSHLDTDEQFTSWQQQFIAAKVNRLDVKQNNVDIEVAGQEGIVSVKRTDTAVLTEPAAPLGILTLNGKDLGRSILESLPQVRQYVQRRNETKPIVVKTSKTCWEAKSGYSFFEKESEPDSSASDGVALRINNEVSWQLWVEQAGKYILWGRVQTRDAQHDSFQVEAAKRLPDGSFMRRSLSADWHLGVRTDWTWVRLSVPITLEQGVWQLTLKPREYEGRIDKLSLMLSPSN